MDVSVAAITAQSENVEVDKRGHTHVPPPHIYADSLPFFKSHRKIYLFKPAYSLCHYSAANFSFLYTVEASTVLFVSLKRRLFIKMYYYYYYYYYCYYYLQMYIDIY